MRAILSFLAALTLLAGTAEARELRPGQYLIGDVHQVCMRATGVWFGLTMESWSGRSNYQEEVKTTFLYGNYTEGSGNSVISVRGRLANWVEWNDEMTYEIIWTGLPVVFVKRRCDRR